MGNATKIEIYWDAQDRTNEGWVLRTTYSDGHRESDPYDASSDACLSDCIIDAAHREGTTITSDDVAVEDRDGGYAIWSL